MDVRIVRMGPFRLAYVHERGCILGEPERRATRKLRLWARERGLLSGPRGYHYFGANDPPPEATGAEYGYFSGLTVPREVEAAGDVRVRDYPPATWVLLRFKGLEHIGTAWEELYGWVRASEVWRVAGHGLEELLAPLDVPAADEEPREMVFDLWLPVETRADSDDAQARGGGFA